jgi:hypothetical protein
MGEASIVTLSASAVPPAKVKTLSEKVAVFFLCSFGKVDPFSGGSFSMILYKVPFRFDVVSALRFVDIQVAVDDFKLDS